MEKENGDSLSSDSSSSQDSVDDEMEEAEDVLLKKLDKVREQLTEQPGSYDLLVEKIQILQTLGELKELRSTRAALSNIYPLTPDLWLSWIEDENNLVTDLDGKKDIIDLFERAIKDYQSVKVWLKYMEHMQDIMEEEDNKDAIRIVMERALASMGLHVMEGHLLWKSYIDFELKLYQTLPTDEQKARYVSLYSRQLGVPSVEMENTYKTISSLFPIDETTEQNYKNSLEKFKELETWETKLVSENKSAESYKEYIKFEKDKKSNPARIMCLYERAICDNALETSLWLDYINYTSYDLQFGSGTTVLEILERAVRNCTWDMSLWTKFLTEAEKFGMENVKSVFERGIVYCTTSELAGNFWLKYLEYFRRKINYEAPVEEDVNLFMKTINAAEEHLTQLTPEPREYIGEILLFGIRVQAHVTKSMIKPRKLWYQALHKGYGQQFKLWIQYFQLEQKYGDRNYTRKCLEKAITVMNENLDIVAELWLNFERDFGNQKTSKHAEDKIMEFVNRKYEADLAAAGTKGNSKKSKFQKRKQKRSNQHFEGDKGPPKRKKFNNDVSEDPTTNSNETHAEFKTKISNQKEIHEKKTIRRPLKSFIPRSLQVQQSQGNSSDKPDSQTQPPGSSNSSSDTQVFKKPMSNADFRNLLKKSTQ